MGKKTLLVFSMLLAMLFVSCTKDETTSGNLAGVNVAVGENNGDFGKLFVLNEGNFKSNNSSLDFLCFCNGKYFTSAFKQVNPTVVQGLGDTGNDMAIYNGKLWIAMNVTGAVQVVSADDVSYVTTIAVPSPRNIAFDGSYAYVTSYAGAVYGSPKEVKGKVYKISTKDYKVVSEVEVGCQPEGLAVSGGKLYVAESGGFNVVKSKTISIIDLKTFSREGEVELEKPNLKYLLADKNGRLWVSSLGLYGSDFSIKAPTSLCKVDPLTRKAEYINDVHVSNMVLSDDFIYCTGDAEEMTGGNKNCLYKINISTGKVEKTEFKGTGLERIKTPYGMLVNPDNGDIYIGDAGTFTDAGELYCFDKELKVKWSTVAGICPIKMLLY